MPYTSRRIPFRVVTTILVLVIFSLIIVKFAVYPFLTQERISNKFPAHSIEYRAGNLVIDHLDVGPVLKIEDGDFKHKYPNLMLLENFSLKRAIYAVASTHVPPDELGYVVAIYRDTNVGFAIEFMNWTQGAFLFAPILNAETALEYTQFMTHEVGRSLYIRDYEEITNEKTFERVFNEMLNNSYIYREMPPNNFSTVTLSNDVFTVERVYLKHFSREKMFYSKSIVNKNGTIETLEERVIVIGESDSNSGFTPRK